jgi:hypothetical protein
MKKNFVIIISLTFLISCSKEYNCSCTNYNADGTYNNSNHLIKGTKDEAPSKCAEKNVDFQPNSYWRTCYLK